MAPWYLGKIVVLITKIILLVIMSSEALKYNCSNNTCDIPQTWHDKIGTRFELTIMIDAVPKSMQVPYEKDGPRPISMCADKHAWHHVKECSLKILFSRFVYSNFQFYQSALSRIFNSLTNQLVFETGSFSFSPHLTRTWIGTTMIEWSLENNQVPWE